MIRLKLEMNDFAIFGCPCECLHAVVAILNGFRFGSTLFLVIFH